MSVETVSGTGKGNGSVIHDIGYQRYTGPRLGRGYATGSLYAHGLRTAFGLGRSAKAKIFPWMVVGIVGIVAAVLTAIRAQSGQVPITYAQFPEQLNFLIILFCAAVAPELVSRDLRSGVLPLYFSRPLERSDYALAKLGALITAVFLMLGGAQLLMFTGGAFTVKGSEVWDEFLDFLPGLANSAIHAILFGSIALLVASLASRRAVAAAVVVAVFLVTTPVVGVLYAVGGQSGRALAFLASPMTMVGGLSSWLFDTPGFPVENYGPLYAATVVALVIVCVTFLLARYRKVAQ